MKSIAEKLASDPWFAGLWDDAESRVLILPNTEEGRHLFERISAAGESGYRRGFTQGYQAALNDVSDFAKPAPRALLTRLHRFLYGPLYAWRTHQKAGFLAPSYDEDVP
jgi:hypothetical protein